MTSQSEPTEALGASQPEAAAPEPRPRRPRRRVLVGFILGLATVIGLVGVMAVWANRQVLDTNNVTNLSSQLLADKQIQGALSTYLVSQVFTSVNVQAEIQNALPAKLAPLAGPLASGTRQLADSQVPRLLASAKLQNVFRGAVRAADIQLLNVLNGGGNVVGTHGGRVTLNVRALITQLAASLGLSSQLAAARSKLNSGAGTTAKNAVQQKLGIKLPSNIGRLVILRSNQLKAAQDGVHAINGLAIVLPLVAFLLFGLAVALAEGWRRRALGAVGWCFVGVGVLLLLARRIGGSVLVNSLVKIDSNKPAVHQIWEITTSLLYDIAIAVLIYGLIIVLASWLAGGTRPATAVRRALAPALRDHLAWAYSILTVFYLLIIVWGPTPAFRQIIPILIIAALVVLGVELLRRSTAQQFPDAEQGDTWHAVRGWYAAHRSGAASTSSADARARHGADALERLTALHDRGALTDAEFASQKALVLGPQ